MAIFQFIAECLIYLHHRKEVKMASNTLKIDELRRHFAGWDHFTSDHINRFYRSRNIFLLDETFRWRIYRLVKMGVLHRIGRGVFKLGNSITFIPEINDRTGNIYKSIQQHFPFATFSIWHTSSLNEFMLHQPMRFMYLVEVEKDAAESIFYYIKEQYKDVFLNPNEEIVQKYIAGKPECIIVKNLITESPLQEIYDVQTPTLEKILVDVFCDAVIFSPYQGNEMAYIFENSFTKYNVNITTLYRYAQRRGKKEELSAYLKNLGLIINQ